MRYAYFGKDVPTYLNGEWVYDDIAPEIIFSFGGDGTMLAAIAEYIDIIDKVKFVGVKSGKLGFFYGFENKKIKEIIEIIKNDEYCVSHYQLLEYELVGDETIKGHALNEIAITNPIHTQIIDVIINDNLFERFRGTGFIVSPPAGSTAYNKSMGGSIIDPLLQAYQLVEIASINNRIYKTISSPIILSKEYILKLQFIDASNVYISVDGREVKCSKLREINCGLSSKSVQILNPKEDFFTKVKKAFLD